MMLPRGTRKILRRALASARGTRSLLSQASSAADVRAAMTTEQFEEKCRRDAAKDLRRHRLQLAAGFLGEAAGGLEDEAFRIEAKRALRWADILLEEAGR